MAEQQDVTGDRFRQLVRLTLYRLLVVSLLLWLTQLQWVRPVWLATPPGVPSPLYLAMGGLFLLSVLYLLWLRSGRGLELLTRIQCVVDPVLVTVLVILTGGGESPLHFLYALTVLTAALLLGRREALVVAALVLLLSMVAHLLAGWLVGYPLVMEFELAQRFLLEGSAYFLTALLGGHLAVQAQALQRAYLRQRDSLADLTALNRQVVEAIPYGLITVNTQGIIRTATTHAGRLLGLPLEGLLGRHLARVLPEWQWALAEEAQQQPVREQTRGEQVLETSVTPLYDRLQVELGTLLVIRDITEQKRLEREYAQREQLAFSGRMAATVAHEIRNPLASIQSAVQLLPLTPDSQGERLRTIMLDEIGRLKQITTDFLFFARPPSPQPEEVGLGALVAEVAEQVRHDPRWGAGRRLEVGGEPQLSAWVDPRHLRQVLWNLLINAAQATGAQGRVWVEITRQASKVALTITDDGPGMDSETLARALEPFFTTRPAGTGLGLAVVAQMMQTNGGSVTLGNAAAKGLRVRLTLRAPHG